MDDGSWGKVVYDLKPYMINDEGEYHSVWKDYKQVASFKNRELAFEYVNYKISVRYF